MMKADYFDSNKIVADVEGHLSEASNRLQDLDEPNADESREALYQQADEAIDAALRAVQALTFEGR